MMKRLAFKTALSMGSSIMSLAASCLLAPAAQASGWIMVDPIGGVPMAPPTTVAPPTTGITPIDRPGHRPRPSSVTLQGHVSVGLHLQAEAVKVEIKDQVAKTYITQTFSNDSDRNLAGTYLFPLPDDTTFSSFSLHIDGKPVEGKILEASAARQEYEQIVRRMVDPGLLEYADYKTVRARIFPIPAHGTKKVELEYTQLLKAENGLMKYRFPLKSKVDDSPAEEIKVDVKIASAQGLRTIWSPTHVISSNRPDNNNAKVGMIEKNSLPDKDFLLYYSVSNSELAANLITHKAEGEDGYFLMTLSPPFQSKAVIGKDVVLVADTSGSMQGEKMDENKRALKYVIKALHPSDRFGLVEFNTDAETFKNNLVPATPENKKAACEFIDELTARGGTNIGDAISIGKTLLAGEATRPAYMIFMTDGEPTVGEREVDKLITLANSKRDVRVFDFGIGYDINTRLLNKLAEAHHGTAQFVEPDENVETALASFYEKIKSPVLSDVKLAYTGMDVKNVYPRDVKDIFAGSQVLLLGRYKKGGNATIALTGKVNGSEKSFSFPLNFATTQAGNSHLVKLWAMRRIGYLTEVAHSNGENKEVIDEIIALSKQHGIISQYTSYLVTDPSENGRLANNLPVPAPPMMSDRRRAGVHTMATPSRGFFGAQAGAGGASAGMVRGTLAQASPRSGARSSMSSDSMASSFGDEEALRDWGASSKKPAMAYQNKVLHGAKQMQVLDATSLAREIKSEGETGQKAVISAKETSKLKSSNVLLADKDGLRSGITQMVGEKTFVLNGITWIDSGYNERTSPKPKTIEFGSQAYFDLLKAEPGLSKYLAVGKQIIVSYKGNVYKIIQTRTASG